MIESQLKDLRAVRALFSGPDKWTKGAYARDSHGTTVDPQSKHAVQWCLSGALWKESSGFDAGTSCFFAIREYIGISIIIWNDAPERTFDDVTALLDKAIEDMK